MPELPDIVVYQEAVSARVLGEVIGKARVSNPFVLRTYSPSLGDVVGKRVERVLRVGKRVVLALSDDLFVAIHLMRAGRLLWKPPQAKIPAKLGLFALDFEKGTLLLTEAGTKKRAAVHVLRGEASVKALDRGGLEVMDSTAEAFRAALVRETHTLKRALTDPSILSGIGNAYSDEILFEARLSPVTMTSRLTAEEHQRLHAAVKETLLRWTAKLRAEANGGFPEKVTAFRPDMAVHGRYGEPCPRCGSPVQRIVRADSETNYCAPCQTGGKLLADRALSRLLGKDWPRTLDELEEHREDRRVATSTEAAPPASTGASPGRASTARRRRG